MASVRLLFSTFLLSLSVILPVSALRAQTPDPGLMGTHTVLKQEYDLGDAYFASIPTYFPYTMECRGSVHYPADLSSGPYPVLVWLHGRHSTCYNPSTLSSSSAWPCPSGRLPIVSYEGYDYAARTMASHGYIVISISANSINAHDASTIDNGMTARGRLVQYHLDLWNGWNTTVTTGPFGSTFVGALDLQNVGTMGHSRGGEGVVYNAEYNRSLGSPYGIKAVLTLAPVDFYRHVLNGIPLMNVAPYCDGDVSDLQGVHFYDNARYKDTTDETPKHTLLVMGANHNYFNTVWTPGSYVAGGADDWLYTGGSTDAYCGPSAPGGTGRLDTTKQKAVYNTYAAAFYRYYIGHELQFAPILQTEDLRPPASALVDSSKLFMSYHPGRTLRHDLNRTDSTTDTAYNTLHGPVTTNGLVSYSICGGGLTMTSCGIGTQQQEPHKGSSSYAGLEQIKLRWNNPTDWFRNEVPVSAQDFSYFKCLQFRASVNYSESSPGPNTDFTVQLIDSAGAVSGTPVSAHTYCMFYQPGTTSSDLPKVCFNTIRIPMTSFTGVNLSKIRYVKFLFDRSAVGSIEVSDLALVEQTCGKLNANYTHTTSGLTATFSNGTISNYGDTLHYLWNFGNPASGTNDTSSLANPTHLYTGSGVYTACLYITATRRNGTVCTDTFCTTVVAGTALNTSQQAEQKISIVPNPARDYLQINGAGKNDMFRLINLYGQEVMSVRLIDAIISLPPQLANGFYYAIVVSPKGNYYQKVLISR